MKELAHHPFLGPHFRVRPQPSPAGAAMRAASCTATHLATAIASMTSGNASPRRGRVRPVRVSKTTVRANGRPTLGALDEKPKTSSSPSRTSTKTLYLIRHGRTEMNDYLLANKWHDENFVDPMMIDTKLTAFGETQALALRARLKNLNVAPDVIVASPLSRALKTAEIAFGDDQYKETKLVTCHLARERVFHGSDVGTPTRTIKKQFPTWCVAEMEEKFGDQPWWYTGTGDDDSNSEVDELNIRNATGDTVTGNRTEKYPGDTGVGDGDTDSINSEDDESIDRLTLRSGVPYEPPEVFNQRMQCLLDWLTNRPEEKIAVVAHWGVWFSLTGREFENCEVCKFSLGDLAPGTGVMPV